MEQRHLGNELVELVSKQCSQAVELDQLQAPREERLRLWQAQVQETAEFIDGLPARGNFAESHAEEEAAKRLLKKLFLPPRPPV